MRAEELIDQYLEAKPDRMTPEMKKIASKLKKELNPDKVKDYGIGTLELQWSSDTNKSKTGTQIMISAERVYTDYTRPQQVGISPDIDKHAGPGAYKKTLKLLGNPKKIQSATGGMSFDWYPL